MFAETMHVLECREDSNISYIYGLRNKYLSPNDIYLATIDMSNGAGAFLQDALVTYSQHTIFNKNSSV